MYSRVSRLGKCCVAATVVDRNSNAMLPLEIKLSTFVKPVNFRILRSRSVPFPSV